MIDYRQNSGLHGGPTAISPPPPSVLGIARADVSAERKTSGIRATLASLSFGNFVIGTGTMIVAGLLNVMAAELEVSIAAIGQLIAGYGIAVCFGAPILASATSRFSRRRLLIGALALFAAGHLLVALAPSYTLVMALRVITGFGAAIFTPQAAATAGLLAPSDQRGRAVAMVFLGFSIASVLGNPLGILLGGAFGWRLAMVAIGVLAALSAFLLRALVPGGLRGHVVDRAAWRDVARNRALLLVLATTFLHATAQFVVIAYLAPIFAAYLGAGPAMIGLLFAWVGSCGVVGNVLAGSILDRAGAPRVVMITLALMLGGMLLWPLTRGSLAFTLLALALWGLGCFATNSAQQARLIALSPRLAAASIALNSSSFYFGQAAGAAIGGIALHTFGVGALSWVGAGILLAAFGSSRAAQPAATAQA